jgi:molybdopterin-dependent oxidoreductase alpha subunit
MPKKPSIEPYNSAAGGWGATYATFEHLIEQGIPLKGSKELWHMNKPGGFDCPGCGWPDPSPKNAEPLVFCENGAKALAWESTARRVTPEFFAEHSVSWLRQQSDYWLEQQGRLTHPMSYNAATDHYEPVAWEQAFADIACALRSLANPSEADFYTSGRSSNEAAFLYQLFVREFGTNNFPDCSNFCHEPTSQGLPPAIGIGKGTCLLEDFEHADAIFIFGQNPGTNSPRMMSDLRAASRRGARIVVFNPVRERALERFIAPQNPVEMVTLAATPIASHYYQVRVGGDLAALKGLIKAIIAADDAALSDGQPRILDIDFIKGHTAGFDELAGDVRAISWDAIEAESGLTRRQLEAAALVYMEASAVIACWGMGITQHMRGTQNVQYIVNLMLLRGNIGRTGAGLVPVRGHSNVQGDRTVGINERPPAALLDRIEAVFGFKVPRAHGHDVGQALDAIVAGGTEALVALGGNFVAASPDTQRISAGIRNLALTVHVATKLNRSHVVHGRRAYILPCIARSEEIRHHGKVQFVTVEDSMCMVHASEGHATPASAHLRSEPWIVAHLARAVLGESSKVRWEYLVEDYDRIRDAIEQVFPIFQGFNARVRVPGGFHLNNSARERIWNTTSGKANFIIERGLTENDFRRDSEVLWLMTMRSHDQYNTTLYSMSDRYRGVFNQRDVLFISDVEMKRRNLEFGDRVDIRTVSNDGVERILRNFKVIAYLLPVGCCGVYYPEGNPLIPLYARDPVSGTPSSKAIPVRITRSNGTPIGSRDA